MRRGTNHGSGQDDGDESAASTKAEKLCGWQKRVGLLTTIAPLPQNGVGTTNDLRTSNTLIFAGCIPTPVCAGHETYRGNCENNKGYRKGNIICMESEKTSGAGNSLPRLTLEAWASSPPASGSPEESKDKIVVTVLGKDRIGIIARITGVLAQHHVNILDISQTIFGELFSMTLIGDIRQADTPFVELKRELVAVGQELGVRVLIQRQEVFERMHRP